MEWVTRLTYCETRLFLLSYRRKPDSAELQNHGMSENHTERADMENERIRIVDIAEELGLSTATVSNVIHGKTKKISDETVKRVQELVEKRGYIPNMAGILLAQNSSKIVGIVINNHEKYEGHVLEDAFIASSLNALSSELDRAGYFMMIRATTDWSEIVRVASMWNMEGLVLIGFCEQDYCRLRESMHIPFVVYDGYFREAERTCNLIIDNYGGGFQAGAYLRRMGHRRVLCIADNFICMDRERVEGCMAAVSENAAEPESSMKDFWQIPMAREERRRFYEDHFSRLMEYTAVFAASDFYAIELIHWLQERGVAVPEQISVIGFDDSPWCEKIHPALTTIRQDAGKRAACAVEILQKLRHGDYEKKMVKLPVFLVERASVKRI